MNYIVTVNNNPVPPNKFKTVQEAYKFVQDQTANWENSGFHAPKYHVYYQGVGQAVEVNKMGEII